MFATATNQTGFLPDEGKYTVECLRIEEAPDNGFGVGVRWILALYEGSERVLQGNGDVLEFWQTTSPNMGPKARARAYVEAFLGRPLDEGERINPNDLPGKRCSGMVIHEESKTKVGVQNAKLVSVKSLTSSAPKSSPREASADAAPDMAKLRADVERKITQAQILGTPKHLDWVMKDLSTMGASELADLKREIQEDIDAG